MKRVDLIRDIERKRLRVREVGRKPRHLLEPTNRKEAACSPTSEIDDYLARHIKKILA